VVYGDGTQSRDFTYVDDIARGTIEGLRPLGYRVVNLGSDCPLGLMQLIRMIEERVGAKAELEFRDGVRADVSATWADITCARKLLGWAPQTSHEQGIDNAVEWYRQNREWARWIRTE
jgi:nucleoside-diphosphate-sugar epimerase